MKNTYFIISFCETKLIRVMKLEIFRLKQGSEISEVRIKSYHILIIENLFPSMSLNTNVAQITRSFATFPGITTCKMLHIAYLFF